MRIITGIPIFGGIASGDAFVIPDRPEYTIPKYALGPGEAEKDWERFLGAVKTVGEALEAELLRTSGEGRLIFESHRMMLQDTVFRDSLRVFFEQSGLNIEYALDRHLGATTRILRGSNNPVFEERADDITDVFGRVMQELLGNEQFDFGRIPQGAIVAARKLRPSDVPALFKRRPGGLCLAEGGASGHLAILTRACGIPAVFAVPNAHRVIPTGVKVILNGAEGKVYVEPGPQTAAGLLEQRRRDERLLALFRDSRSKPCVTRDGRRIFLLANIGKGEEALEALEEGADGIGLFRTEFLFMDERAWGRSPGGKLVHEDEQYEAYKTVLEVMQGRPVTIRTLDAGGDKFVGSLGESPSGAPEENPLLGERSIRLTLRRPGLFKIQLRALYRASVHGNLRIMIPLVVSLAEVTAVRRLIRNVQKQLAAENIPFNPKTPVGMMVETPAAALSSDAFARHCDFFSVGTNDLTQYSLGIDRENPAVSSLYDEYHLTVLRMIQITAGNALAAGIPVSVCGEMAGAPEGAAFLAGLGIDSLSMAAPLIPRIKHTLSLLSSPDLALLAREALAVHRGTSSFGTVRKLYKGLLAAGSAPEALRSAYDL
ncbi:MAG: phosphoenolpyruvate--protein phosphotransferase [Spirochaetaceae bacterium]|jgi:phosphotransferase system enzyme I (PtsI)|nr:phosphoenolpyruvate--protein phosphotransferase [Spirochaetaceae bacterium]